jgi:hypothetical protein
MRARPNADVSSVVRSSGEADPDLVADRPEDEEAAAWRAEGVRGRRCGQVVRVGMGEI